MDDWKRYRLDMYRRFSNDVNRGFQEREIAYRALANYMGVYETPKSYNDDGVAYNDGTWLIYNTSRMQRYDDKVVYKDKVFCRDKNQIIEDLYSYVLFLRKIGIEVVYEMNYYAVAFLTKYLRFYDKVFDCTMENKKKVGELCQAVLKKVPEEIDCSTRIDSRQFAIDPFVIRKLTKGKTRKQATAEITKFQKRIQKQMKDDLIKKWYDPQLSVRQNKKVFMSNGVEISVGRLYQWIKEYVKEPGVRYGLQNR